MSDLDPIDELWLYLLGFYGGHKAATLGEEPPEAWRVELADVPREQIRAACRRLGDRHPTWPPTAGEFRALATFGEDLAHLSDGELVDRAHRLGVRTYGVRSREQIVAGIRHAEDRAAAGVLPAPGDPDRRVALLTAGDDR